MNSWYTVLLLVALAIAFGLASGFVESDDTAMPLAVIAGAAAVIGVVLFLVIGSRQLVLGLQRGDCNGFAKASGHEVEWVEYDYWNWDCLVNDPETGWVPKSNFWNSRP